MQRYYTYQPRYVDGVFVHADPEHPALVEFPDDLVVKEDLNLVKAEGIDVPVAAKPKKLKPAYNKKRLGPDTRPNRDVFGREGKRPSDEDPAKG